MHIKINDNYRGRTLALSLALLLSVSCVSACGSTSAETGGEVGETSESVIQAENQEIGEITDQETIEDSSINDDLESIGSGNDDAVPIASSDTSDLHALFLQVAGDLPEIAFYQADFDGDGTEEAFGIAGKEDVYGEYCDTSVYFISPAGEVSQLAKGQIGYGQAWMFTVSGKAFVNWSISESPAAYGGTVDVYGVKDGKPYQPIEDYETSKGDIILGYSASQTPGEVNAETYGFTDDGFREFRSQEYLFDTATGKFVEK